MTECSKPALRLRVTAAAEKMARGGHPWIFADSVKEQNREGEAGELAVIFDRRDSFLAVGLFDPDSPIRVRILKAGKPRVIDSAWLKGRIAEACERRKGVFDKSTTGYRLANGESDGLPGMVADLYSETLALKLYTAAWLSRAAELARDFIDASSGTIRSVVLRLSRNIQRAAEERFGLSDGQTLLGQKIEEPVVFLENGLRFESDPVRGQKTGFFLDQRDNRDAVRRLAAGRSALNLFSFSGGFSVAAAAGGAVNAISLDISEHALAAARRNFALNESDASVKNCGHETVRADAFEWLQQKAGQKFDLVVVDPPSLARRENERRGAVEAYGKLIGAALERLREGGVLVACSCSAHVSQEEFFGVARETARRSGRRWRELQTTGHAADHRATFPEGKYLKAIYLTV